jgi:gluconokinase
MRHSVVFMGVAGCGKSTVAAAVARAESAALIEGDAFHSATSRDKMARGIPLTDADRESWLATLGEKLHASAAGVVLTCSALKRAYRDRLRAAAPDLRFVFLDIDQAAALARVAARAAHFFSPSLVASQFATLESPVGEPGVLRVDALAPLSELQVDISNWLHSEEKP